MLKNRIGKLSCILFILVLVSSGHAIPNQNSVKSTPAFEYYVDITQFQYDDSTTYMEYAIDLSRSLITHIPDSAGYCGEYLVTVQILDDDSIVTQKHWRSIDRCNTLEDIEESQRLYSKNFFLLPKGEYVFRIEIEDPNSRRKAEYTAPIRIKGFDTSKLAVSDIQLANNILPDSSHNIYTKNGYRIIPNPSRLYGIYLPVLTGYSEIYHLAPATSDSGNVFKVHYTILNAQEDTVQSYDKVRNKPGDSAVNLVQMTVANLVSGRYTLVMEVTDPESGETAKTNCSFQVYRKIDFEPGGSLHVDESKTLNDQLAEALDKLSEDELDQEFDYTDYISTKEEKKYFKKASIKEKREFLNEFWIQHEAVWNKKNEGRTFRDDYLERVALCNSIYKGSFKPGYKTDRGRVLLLYGKPDDVERMTFGANYKSHEIWFYHDLEGGVQFIFVDKREMGDMELVHSTARGELYDEGWERWLH